MKSTYVKIALFVLIVGMLTACGAQAISMPASSSTDPSLSTDIAAPTETTVATGPAATTEPAAQGGTVSFAHDVLPIIERRCTNCHGGDRVEKGLNLKTYDELMAGSESGPVVTAGNAADSKLIELVLTQKMPKRGPKLTPPQVQLITEWVNQGALNN